jgi:hypothetical protein
LTDYYQLLNIPRDADRKAIKKAYRHLALQFHPDVRPNDKSAENHFKAISTAYRTLINPVRRAQYDHTHNNITNNPKIYPPLSTMPDPTTNFMLRIIFLGFGVTLLMIAVQVSLIVHYSNNSNNAPNETSPFSTLVPELERATLSPSQQSFIFSADPDTPTCTLNLADNTHTCTNTTHIHLQSLTADHQSLLILNFADLSQYSGALLAITYTKIPDAVTVHIGNPDSDDGSVQIVNQTLTIVSNTGAPPKSTPLLRLPLAIQPKSTLFLAISPNMVQWKIENHAESVHSRYLFPFEQSSDENTLYLAFNRGLNDNHQIGSGIASVQIWLLPSTDIR